LAASLNAASGSHVTATTLPFNDITFSDDERAVQFVASGSNWRCSLGDYACTKTGAALSGRGGRGAGPSVPSVDENGDVVPFEGPWLDEDDGLVEEVEQQQQQRTRATEADNVRRSPDGAREAYIQNFNVYVRPTGARDGGA